MRVLLVSSRSGDVIDWRYKNRSWGGVINASNQPQSATIEVLESDGGIRVRRADGTREYHWTVDGVEMAAPNPDYYIIDYVEGAYHEVITI